MPNNSTGTLSDATVDSTPRVEFLAGTRDIFPLVLGAIPFGLIFGALSVTSGLSSLAAIAMSAIVFAGSAQFVAVGMVATGASAWLIVFTTLVINLRHILYAATLAPHLRNLKQRWLLPLGFTLTDESFVTSVQRYNRDDGSPYKHWYHLGTVVPLYVNWQIFTWVGIWAGKVIPNPAGWGLDFAFIATFLGMLIPQIVNRALLTCVLVAATAAMLFHGLPNQLGLIVASISGVVAGVLMERHFPATGPTSDPSVDEEEEAIENAFEGPKKP